MKIRVLMGSLLMAGWSGIVLADPLEVKVVPPAEVSAATEYVFPGKTEPEESARVFTRATGIVSERRVDIGDRVKTGDVLAVISAPDVDRQVDAAQAALRQAKAHAANARNRLIRSERLLATRAISQEDFDQRKSEADMAVAAEAMAAATLARAEEQQRFGTVRAPFDGVIAERNFDRGDRVRGDSATAEGWLYHAVRLDKLRFAVQVSPNIALRLKKGSLAVVRFNEFPGENFSAKVARLSGVFDPDSGTMRVELELDNADGLLPPGLAGRAVFLLPPKKGQFLVPANAVVSRAGQTMVAVVNAEKVSFVHVALGKNHGASVEVNTAQLQPDSRVILNPNALLREGDAVRIGGDLK